LLRLFSLAVLSIIFASCGDQASSSGVVTQSNSNSTTSSTGQSLTEANTIHFNNAATDLTSTTIQSAVNEVNEKLNQTNQIVATLQGITACPTNTTKILDNTCMENNERPQNTYNEASKTCSQLEMKLCSVKQFFDSCFNNTLFPAIVNLHNNNYEWTGDLQKQINFALSFTCGSEHNALCNTLTAAPVLSVTAIGNNSCTAVTGTNPENTTQQYPFRCCVDLK
jgi:hypothetical protein